VDTIELAVWAAMTGSAALLTTTAAVAALLLRTAAAWRGLALIGLISASAVLMSGLPEYLLHITDPGVALPLKLTLGPLSGALCLMYLANWLGITAEERGAQRWVTLGSLCSWVGGLAVLCALYLLPGLSTAELLMASGAVNMVPVVVAIGLTVRNMLLGDALARWMLIACVSLAVMVLGLYAKGLGLLLGVWVWLAVAGAAMAYLVMAVGLTMLRYQHERRLQRIAQGNTSTDPITGLSVGSVLLTKADDAMWRSARLGRDAAVLAVWVNNLYELNETGGNETVQEIRLRLTTSMRRAVGFKDVVGLMQARCYVVVAAAVKTPADVDKIAQKLLTMLPRPMRVGAMLGEAMVYIPEVSVGMVYIPHALLGEPLQAIDQALRLAQNAMDTEGKLLQEQRAA
jgi:GGDEF domain-containing protein